MTSIVKLLSGRNIIIGLIILFMVGLVYSYSRSKTSVFDGMSGTGSSYNGGGSHVGVSGSGEPTVRHTAAQYMPATTAGVPVGGSSGYAAHPSANPSELLPQDTNSAWAQLNPNASTNQVIIPDLLEAGYHIGLDTIGQTMKNPNLQERSEPIIPKQNVSPWNNSSFEPDIARVPLEIGYGCN